MSISITYIIFHYQMPGEDGQLNLSLFIVVHFTVCFRSVETGNNILRSQKLNDLKGSKLLFSFNRPFMSHFASVGIGT